MNDIRISAQMYARQTGLAVYLYEAVLAIQLGKPALVRLLHKKIEQSLETREVREKFIFRILFTGRVLHANAQSGLIRTTTAIWLPRFTGYNSDHFGLE